MNLNATDNQGWTAVHHTVCPLELGTFDNKEILTVLANCNADIQKKDNAGLSPLDHALIRGACKLAALLQKLSNVPEDKMVSTQVLKLITIIFFKGEMCTNNKEACFAYFFCFNYNFSSKDLKYFKKNTTNSTKNYEC